MIIGIGNKARQGKDTAGEFLKKKYGFRLIHFADALYDECRNCTILYDEPGNTFHMKCYDEEYYAFSNPPDPIKEWIKTNGVKETGLPFGSQWIYRGMKEKDGTLLQFWGTEFRRRLFNWNYWVDKVKDVLSQAPGKNYIIPDARFKNEAELIKSVGGEVWKVIRPDYNNIDRNPSHKSEVDLDDWVFDVEIVNDGTIEDLYNKVDKIYQERKSLYE